MKDIAKENLLQLKSLVDRISTEDYIRHPEVLMGASIGQHIRHILEFYLLLISGSFTGTISYDKRKRDIRIEKDPGFSGKTIDRIIPGLDTLDLNLPVKLEADYTEKGDYLLLINSSTGRELSYCIEHSIHHQALIMSGLIALGLRDLAAKNFGVAYSTIRYRQNSCAQ